MSVVPRYGCNHIPYLRRSSLMLISSYWVVKLTDFTYYPKKQEATYMYMHVYSSDTTLILFVLLNQTNFFASLTAMCISLRIAVLYYNVDMIFIYIITISNIFPSPISLFIVDALLCNFALIAAPGTLPVPIIGALLSLCN